MPSLPKRHYKLMVLLVLSELLAIPILYLVATVTTIASPETHQGVRVERIIQNPNCLTGKMK